MAVEKCLDTILSPTECGHRHRCRRRRCRRQHLYGNCQI